MKVVIVSVVHDGLTRLNQRWLPGAVGNKWTDQGREATANTKTHSARFIAIARFMYFDCILRLFA